MTRIRPRGAAAALAALVAVSALLGPGTSAAQESTTLRYLGSPPSSLDPARAADAGTVQVQLQLYAGLTRIDEAGDPYGLLARDWQVSDDGLTYTFRLRPNLRFSDGSPLTAADVRRSWLRLLDPRIGSAGAVILADIDGAAEYAAGAGSRSGVGVEAVDDETVVVELAHPASHFPAALATPATAVVPPVADAGTDWAEPGDFIASGPYRAAAMDDAELRLVANDEYAGGAPAIEEIRIVFTLDGEEPASAFAAGDLDVTPVAPWDAAWIRYDAELGVNLHPAPSLTVRYFGFDTSRPPFDDARVRRAFALALDRPRIVELESGRGAMPAASIVPPALWPPGFSQPTGAEVDDARRLLSEAGYADGTELGPLRVSYGGFAAPGAIAGWREELGVHLDVETMEFETYYAELETRPPQVYTIIWIADYPSPQALYGMLLTPGAAANYGGWRSDRFDALLREAAAADTPEARDAGYLAVEELLAREAPVVPYAYDQDWWLVRGGLRGAGSLTIGLFDFGRLSWAE